MVSTARQALAPSFLKGILFAIWRSKRFIIARSEMILARRGIISLASLDNKK
jgi:hypothetical protein